MRVLRTSLRRTPLLIMAPLWRHRDLIRELVIRDLAQRYRGSLLGWLWAGVKVVFEFFRWVSGLLFPRRGYCPRLPIKPQKGLYSDMPLLSPKGSGS